MSAFHFCTWSNKRCLYFQEEKGSDEEDDEDDEKKPPSSLESPNKDSSKETCKYVYFYIKRLIKLFMEVLGSFVICSNLFDVFFSGEQKAVGKIIKFGTNIDLSDPKR